MKKISYLAFLFLLLLGGLFTVNAAGSSETTLENNIIPYFENVKSMTLYNYDGIYTITKITQNHDTIKSALSIIKNKTESDKIPGVAINKCVATDSKATHAAVPEDGETGEYIDTLTKIKSRVEKKHEYWIELSYQKNGLVDYITITYDSNNPEAIYTRDHINMP